MYEAVQYHHSEVVKFFIKEDLALLREDIETYRLINQLNDLNDLTSH